MNTVVPTVHGYTGPALQSIVESPGQADLARLSANRYFAETSDAGGSFPFPGCFATD